MLIQNGKSKGDIILIIGDDLLNDPILQTPFIQENEIQIKHFPDFQFPGEFLETFLTLEREPHWSRKVFQYQKFWLFSVFFKQWDTVFYSDCGLLYLESIQPILDTRESGVLLAHSDAYPTYAAKLSDQFDKTQTKIFTNLSSKYDLNIDFFQTTMMYYDTSIIESDTVKNLYELAIEYPISITNDQGIIALYFTNIKKVWKQIPLRNEDTWFYDFMRRGDETRYIMLKRA